MKNFLTKMLNWFKNLLDKVPSFSEANMHLACKICGGIISVSCLFFIYEMFTYDGFGITVNWNIFTSIWFSPLFFIGLILAIVNWGKFGHWGGQPYNIYEDSNGNKYKERNDDIMDNTFYQILMPILGHFVIEPIVYACIIYYPIACVFAIFAAILPYALTLILIAICVLFFLFDEYIMNLPYRSILIVLVTLLLAGGLTWASIDMESSKPEEINSIQDITEQIDTATEQVESISE